MSLKTGGLELQCIFGLQTSKFLYFENAKEGTLFLILTDIIFWFTLYKERVKILKIS